MPACVQNLLTAGADPDSEDPDRETPLLLALMNMHFDTAAVLVKGGADLDKWDLFGRSPVYMAADVSTLPMKGNGAMAVIPSPDKLTAVDVGRMMLETGANPNIQLKRRPPYRDVPQDRGGDGMLAQGATPLLRAARGGDDKFVALLLKYKALVDLPSKEGITPLMAAAGVDFGTRATRGRNRTDEGVLATMDLLVKAGANVNAQSSTEPRAVAAVVVAVAVAVALAAVAAAPPAAAVALLLLLVAALAVVSSGGDRQAASALLSAMTVAPAAVVAAVPSRQSDAERERRAEPNRSARRRRTRLRQVHRIPRRQRRRPDREGRQRPYAPRRRPRRRWRSRRCGCVPEDRRTAGILDESEGDRSADVIAGSAVSPIGASPLLDRRGGCAIKRQCRVSNRQPRRPRWLLQNNVR